jgi:hypothetical protein
LTGTSQDLDDGDAAAARKLRTSPGRELQVDKRVAIVQSNYIPWKGYFDLIASVDEFVLFDDVQYTRRDWRNRNLIKTPAGTKWLTVPVKVKGRYAQTIRETEIDGGAWADSHWGSICQNYRRAPHFESMRGELEELYVGRGYTHLSELNRTLIEWVCRKLGIDTAITSSADYELQSGKNERLIGICRQARATQYLSGPSARGYVDERAFEAAGISLSWFDYTGYPTYPQLWSGFTHEVTVLDLLLNCGDEARSYMTRSSG